MNHTPGPWHYHTEGKLRAFILDSEGFTEIGLKASQNTDQQSRLIPNARLISAAPDLADALQWALEQLDDDLDPMHQQAFAHARAVLAAATGEQA